MKLITLSDGNFCASHYNIFRFRLYSNRALQPRSKACSVVSLRYAFDPCRQREDENLWILRESLRIHRLECAFTMQGHRESWSLLDQRRWKIDYRTRAKVRFEQSTCVICSNIWIFSFGSLRFKVLGTGELLITNLRFNDMGTYICLAKNSVSKDVVSTFLYPLANKKWTRGLRPQQSPSRHPHDGKKYTKHSAIISTNILTFINEMSPQNDT